MAARGLELPALIRDLAEQPGILDGQSGLGGEGLEEVHDLVRELPHCLPPHRQDTQDPLLGQERHGQHRAVAEAEERTSEPGHGVCFLVADVGHLDRLATECRLARRPFAEVDRVGALDLQQLLRHPMTRLEPELLGCLVVLVDQSAGGPGELHRAAHDRVQDGREIEGRADRPADGAQGLQLLHRSRQISGPGLQFLEQPDVLDRDDGLVGEGLDEVDLLVGEGSHHPAPDRDDPDRRALPHQRHG